jgi:hypothetical protein
MNILFDYIYIYIRNNFSNKHSYNFILLQVYDMLQVITKKLFSMLLSFHNVDNQIYAHKHKLFHFVLLF